MAVTRIQNNQITDKTITYAKIADNTLTGGQFNQNLTLNSNVTIVGNLSISGNTTTIQSTNTYVNDPLIVFNNGYTGAATYDIGMLVNRNLASMPGFGAVNAFLGWKESDQAFEGIATVETGTTAGTINNSGFANLRIGNVTANSLTLSTGTLTASNGIINTPISGSTGSFTTLFGTNFSTGNAQITGGTSFVGTTGTPVAGVYTTTAQIQTAITQYETVAVGFYSPNVFINGGYLNNLANIAAGTAFLATLNSSTGNITALSGTSANIITVYSANFGSPNVRVTGGYLTGLANVSTTYDTVTNFYTANAVIAGGYISALSNIGATYGTFTNLYAANATIASGTFTGGAVNAVAGNITTGYFGSLNTANAVISGGYISALSNVAATYATFTNLASGNAVITGGSITGDTSGTFVTLQGTNFSTGNAQITGGSITGLVQLAGQYVTATTGLSTANAVITGGSVNSTPIGGTTASSGAFTTLSASNQLYVSTSTASTTANTGALVVAGGVGIGGDLNVGGKSTITGNLTISGNLSVTGNSVSIGSSTLSVNDPIINLHTPSDLTPLTTNDGFDIGIKMHYYNGVDSAAFMGRANDTGYLEWYGAGTDIANVFVGTAYGGAKFGSMILANARTATGGLSANTGTLQVYGDGSVSGNLYVGGTLTLPGITVTGTGGGASSYAPNFSSPNVLITGGSITGITSGTFTTLQATNFSSGNAVITGGSISGITIPSLGTIAITNLSTANAVISGGYISALSNVAATYATFTNLASGNAVITGSQTYIGTSGTPIANIYASLGTFTTLNTTTEYATNLGSPNLVVTGGSINNTVIGNATPAAATFTTVVSTGTAIYAGNIVGNSTTASTSTTTGALVLTGTGGAGIGGALNVGGISTLGGNLVLTAATNTNNNTTGALVIANGGIAVLGNINSAGQMFIGSLAQSTPLTSAIAVKRGTSITGAGVQYTQDALINATNTGSSDFIAYPNNYNLSVGDQGWMDMGFTGDAFSDVNYTITKSNDGYLFASGANTSVGGNLVMATGGTGSYNDIVIGVGGFVSSAEVARFHGNTATSGNFTLKLPTNNNLTANTGAFQVWGGASITGNVYHGSAAIFNGSGTAGNDVITKGVNDATLIWARPSATYDQVIIGNSATTSTLVVGAKLQINSTDAMLVPVGTQAQRPGTSGYGTAVAGMMRYNKDNGFLEWYNGTAWQTAQTNVITIATDQQFTGNGVQTVWGLSQSTTTAGTIVSINGVVQIPTLAYSVTSGTVLTFTEAPASTDVIDVRILTTTQTVTSLSSTNGAMQVSIDNNGLYIATGTVTPTITTTYNTAGAEVWSVANVSVASSGSATQIDSFATATYRSAQYTVQVTNGTSNYQVFDALLIHNGATANLVVINSATMGSSTGALTATVSGGNAILNFTATNAGNQVRVRKVYQTI